jgi:site-specific DNA-cytosine methylase
MARHSYVNGGSLSVCAIVSGCLRFGARQTVRDAFAGLGELWGQMQSRPDTLEKLSHAVVGKWTPMDPEKKFDGMTRLAWDRPSLAIVNLKKVYMRHPDENRNISLAEAAALQGFPPGYVWKGNESQIAQMIANAMPSPLAESIAGSLAGVMSS